MLLDTPTLFTVATCVTGLLGMFLLVLWVQERSIRALAWWGAAYLIGGSAVALWGLQGNGHASLPMLTPDVPYALLFVSCGLIWNGARLFQGRSALPGGLLAGAIIWFAAVQVSGFENWSHARVVLSSLIIATYAFLTALEFGRERRRTVPGRLLAVGISLLHGAVFLAPIPLTLLLPPDAPTDRWFALFALETLLYVVGTAFIVAVMAKDRVALVHKTAAMTDVLTGLFNRRAFIEAAHQMIAKRARKRLPVSVLAFDLDHFKSINDRFGHAVGDETLQLFAAIASGSMRATDMIGRLGGEEFVAIVPGTAADAAVVAERVRAAYEVAGKEISSHQIGSTVSIGLASATGPVELTALLARADAALYRAKSGGRNRIEMAADEPAVAPEGLLAEETPPLVPAMQEAATA